MKSTGVQVRLGSKQDQLSKYHQKPITLAHLRELVREAEQLPDDTVIQINDVQSLDGMSWSRCLRIRVVQWTEETSNVAISK